HGDYYKRRWQSRTETEVPRQGEADISPIDRQKLARGIGGNADAARQDDHRPGGEANPVHRQPRIARRHPCNVTVQLQIPVHLSRALPFCADSGQVSSLRRASREHLSRGREIPSGTREGVCLHLPAAALSAETASL